jgi:hypothetical protein
MKFKVLKKFNDKHNGKTYSIGDEIEVNEKRGKELLSHSLELVEVIEEEEKITEVEKPKRKKTSE